VVGDDRFSFNTLRKLLSQNFGPNAPQSFTVEYTNVHGVTLKAESDVVLGEIFFQAHNAQQRTLKLCVNAVQVQSYVPSPRPSPSQPLYDLEAGTAEPEEAEVPKPSFLSSMLSGVTGGGAYSRVMTEEPEAVARKEEPQPKTTSLTSLVGARIRKLVSLAAFMVAMLFVVGIMTPEDDEGGAAAEGDLTGDSLRGHSTATTRTVEFVYDTIHELAGAADTVMLNVPLALCMASMSSIAGSSNPLEIERDVSKAGLVNLGADGVFGTNGFVSMTMDGGAVVVTMNGGLQQNFLEEPRLAQFNTDVMVDADMLVAYQNIRGLVLNGIDSALAQAQPSPKLYITGYNVGGGLAELVAIDIASGEWGVSTEDFSEIRLVTFDAPLVGDAAFTSTLSTLVPQHLDIISEERVSQPGFSSMLENTVLQTPSGVEQDVNSFLNLYATVLKTRSFASGNTNVFYNSEVCAHAL
jgi:hypothetical protein